MDLVAQRIRSKIVYTHTSGKEDLLPKSRIVPEPVLLAIANNLGVKFHEIPEYSKCVSVMLEDPVISKHIDNHIATVNGGFWLSAWDYLSDVIVSQFPSYPNNDVPKFSIERFESTYTDLEQFFYSEGLPESVIAPLQNFDCDQDRIDLGQDLFIRKLTEQEQQSMLNSTNTWLPAFWSINVKFVLQCNLMSRKAFNVAIPDWVKEFSPLTVLNTAEEKISIALTILRLFKSGAVGISYLRRKCSLNIPFFRNMTAWQTVHGIYIGSTYNLTKEELPSFHLFWSNICDKSLEGVAVRRFNYSYGRANPEDKLIDLMIAFEALFLKGENGGNAQGAIIAVACSALIGKNEKNRKEIREKIKKAYHTRNEIVHGCEQYSKGQVKQTTSLLPLTSYRC